MRRDLSKLAERRFDVLVIGAGIHGSAIAREAALRGLSVALVDRGDFGAATSANSLKIIHGGLRYLQTLDIKRLRQSVREQQAFMQLAPHLVRPLPCVIPTYGWGSRSKVAMKTAFKLYDLLKPKNAYTRSSSGRLPNGRVISKDELFNLFPGLDTCEDITGGALWYDLQAYNTERLTLAFVRSAVEHGAIAANYLDVHRIIIWGNRVVGGLVRDRLRGDEFEISARMVVNAAGPWACSLTTGMGEPSKKKPLLLCKAWNVVTKQLHPTHALGLPIYEPKSRRSRSKRMLFFTPWRGRSIVGTLYTPVGEAHEPRVSEAEIQHLLNEVNQAYPAARLSFEDIFFCHVGLLPVQSRDEVHGIDKLAERNRIIDHEREDHLSGMLTVVGVKYTTARGVAEQVTNRVCAHLGRKEIPQDSAQIPLDGGDIDDFERYQTSLEQQASVGAGPAVFNLARNYGTRAIEIIEHCRTCRADGHALTETSQVLRAEVRYAVREEWAVKLADVVLRRTELGTAGYPGKEALRNCALIMAEELGWNEQRIEQEIKETTRCFDPLPVTESQLRREGADHCRPQPVGIV